MSYMRKNLLNSEQIIYETRLHWIVFLWPIIFAALGVFMFGDPDTAPLASFFFILAIVTAIAAFIQYKTSEFGVTNKRVMVKVGFIRRSSIEVLLQKIESINVDQGILGRMLGYGTIVISGTGGTKNTFKKISSPLELRRQAQEQLARIHDAAEIRVAG